MSDLLLAALVVLLLLPVYVGMVRISGDLDRIWTELKKRDDRLR